MIAFVFTSQLFNFGGDYFKFKVTMQLYNQESHIICWLFREGMGKFPHINYKYMLIKRSHISCTGK